MYLSSEFHHGKQNERTTGSGMNSFLSSVCTDMPWKPWYAMGVVVVMQRKMHTWYSVEPCDGRGEAGFLPSWLPVFEFMQLHTF